MKTLKTLPPAGHKLTELIFDGEDDERGMVTAEYAIGTIAAASLAGLLITLLSSQWMQDLLKKVLEAAFANF